MDIHGHFVIGEIKKAILNVSKSKPSERSSTSFDVPVESSSHYINELDGVIRILLWVLFHIAELQRGKDFKQKR